MIPASNPQWQTVQSTEQWVSALQVFDAIYSEKAPHDTLALIKYGSVIRELASQGANWKFYDKNFPSIRQTQGAPGDQSHAELWPRPHYFQAKPRTQEITCPGCSYKHQYSGVGTATQFPNINQPPNSPWRIRHPNQLLIPPRALPSEVLPSEALPTPVKARSLAAYLTGYEENLRKHLSVF